MNPDDLPGLSSGGLWSYVGAAIGSLATGATLGSLWLRRKLSTDATAIAGDRAEVDIIKTLQDDNTSLRASLREVNAERDKLWKEMAEMSATLKIMEFKLTAITEELSALRAQGGNAT
ncbi:hypothetical protein [Agrobacterium tumefaciens]|uniref:hypothetical protein n=1 Tax=Agrobacterium tumefaciens TaxID=358 RepID=UPI0015728D16|nr:hypothetical protein [Agrobacterium tumefaciens]